MAKLFGRSEKMQSGTILVVGLGRYGWATARTLNEMGVDVMAVDNDPVLVERYGEELPHVAQLDATSIEALRQIGLDAIERAVVAMGHLEASIITVLNLKDAGVKEVWAKAVSRTHGEILARVGADRVVYPERSAGERTGHAIAGHMIDYFEFEDGFALARTEAPSLTWGRTLAESQVRKQHNVTVVGLKRPGQDFTYAVPETLVLEGDELIVSGEKILVERFARLI